MNWSDPIPAPHHPVTEMAKEQKEEPEQVDEYDLFGDQNDLSLFDLDAIDEGVLEKRNTVEGDDDFIEDDDGGGYKEDLRADADYGKYMERSKKESLRNLERGLSFLNVTSKF